jgi:TPR repeat protein
MTAQTLAGTLYYQGHDPELPQDYGQALVWLKKAAAQGSYAAQRTLAEMYTLGEGTAPNAETAHYYDGKADEQQRLKEREEDRADRQADQTKMLNGFVMGAVFGALMF